MNVARADGAMASTPRTARAVLFTWTDIAPEDEAGFNDWYNREHMRDRILALPGFIRGRRYENTGQEGPKYLAFYEAWDPGVFQSREYIGLVREPDPASRHYILRFRNVIRTIARVVKDFGEAEGACLAAISLSPESGSEEALRHDLLQSLVPELIKMPGIVAARMIERDDSLAAKSTGGHVRQGDRRIDWGLFVEATHMEPLRAAVEALCAKAPLANIGMGPLGGPAYLRLLYRVSPA